MRLPEDSLSFQFVRSSGPGGQHVNKVASAVQLRLDLNKSGLPQPVRDRLVRLAGKRATTNDEIIIVAERFRSQHRNRADALERLQALVDSAWHRPKRRIKTKPSKAARMRRLDTKKLHGRKKRLRKSPPAE